VRERAARARVLALSYPKAVVARVMQVSRQSLYPPAPKPSSTKPAPPDDVESVIVEVAKANPTDGYRMVAAIASRQLGGQSTASGCCGCCERTDSSSAVRGFIADGDPATSR